METLTLIITIILILIFGAFIYIIYRDMKQRQFEFKLKLESAKNSRGSNIRSMSYKDLLAIIDTNMVYYVDQSILISGIASKKSDEERSLIFNDILTSTCAQVELSLSNYVKEALLDYISEDHLNTYIKDRARILLIAKIEQNNINNRNAYQNS